MFHGQLDEVPHYNPINSLYGELGRRGGTFPGTLITTSVFPSAYLAPSIVPEAQEMLKYLKKKKEKREVGPFTVSASFPILTISLYFHLRHLQPLSSSVKQLICF